MTECPICGEELITEPKIYVGGCVGEEHIRCPEKHYYYSYTYGVTRFIIGDKTFGWHYTDSKEKVGKIRKKIEEEVEKLKGGIVNGF